MQLFIKRIVLILVVLLSLPVLFQLYQPILLGTIGLFLGAIGFFLSPIILFAVLLVFVIRAWNN